MPDATDRPNIVFILADDMGFWAMGCAGNREIRTPNLDRLAAAGTRLTHMHCVTPVCSAARAAILTGTNASVNGVHDFLSLVDCRDVEFLAGQRAWTDVLAESGYTCGHVGKWHLGAIHKPQKSNALWRTKRGNYRGVAWYDETGNSWVAPEAEYVTEAITDGAVDFIANQAGRDRPFCLNVWHYAPHSPWDRENHLPEIWDSYHENCPFDSAPIEPMHPRDGGLTDFFTSPQRRRQKLSGYYAAITAMDAGVGRILDELDNRGLRENTVIVFTSDNGMNMGHHGVCGKGNGTRPVNMYEESVRVPAIVSWPAVGQPGQVSDALLSHYDLFPTLLEFAGAAEQVPSADRPGRSFAPLLAGDALPEGQPVVVFEEYGPTRMIRDRQWKYVHRCGDGDNELYDLETDPGERVNLAWTNAYADRIAEMGARLDTWFGRFSVPGRDGAHLPVTGCGQRDLAEVPDAFAQDWPEHWKRREA